MVRRRGLRHLADTARVRRGPWPPPGAARVGQGCAQRRDAAGLWLALWALLLWAGPALAAGAQPPLLAHTVGEGEEQVAVLLPAEGYAAPAIEVLAGDWPRVVTDFSDIPSWDGPEVLEVGSPLVRRVRTWLHGKERRLRVVLDLAADPARLLVTHTYETVPGGVRALVILRPVGP